jgi:hypothetical protein
VNHLVVVSRRDRRLGTWHIQDRACICHLHKLQWYFPRLCRQNRRLLIAGPGNLTRVRHHLCAATVARTNDNRNNSGISNENQS